MKGRRIVLDQIRGREAAALMVDGRLDDLLIDDDAAPRPGAIFRAICDRPMKGQGGMFLRLPEGETAFLRGAKGLRPGEPLLVQVTGVAEPGKAVPVTDRLLFKSRHVIVTPGAPGVNVSRQIQDEEERDLLKSVGEAALAEAGETGDLGLILRSAAAGTDPADITEDAAAMLKLALAVLADAEGDRPEALTEGDGPHVLAWRDWSAEDIVTDPDAFAAEGILDQIAALPSGRIDLGDGAVMYLEVTRALIAVDVNTGPDTSPAAALKANLAAARALPRALRLRGLGGQVTVDFAPVSKAQRQPVEQSLKASFRNDPIETSLAGWTPMGLFELNRKRERVPLLPLVAGLE